MKSVTIFVTVAATGLAFTSVSSAQQPDTESTAIERQAIPLSAFENAAAWRIYAPGDLKLRNEDLHDLRIVYGATLFTQNGPITRQVSFDVRDVMAGGRKADWIQWSFTGEKEGEQRYPNLDLLIIDSETGQLHYRMFPAVPTVENGGTYSFITVSRGEVNELTVKPDGQTYPEVHDLDGEPVFDFASLGFVLPFLDLQDREGIRLRTYNYSSVGSVSVYPYALKDVQLPSGQTARVRDIDVLVSGGTQLITYRVSKEAPYFYGWNYRRVSDGVSLFRMDYRGFVLTNVGVDK